MQTNAIVPLPGTGKASYEELARRLRALVSRINTLQAFVDESEDGDDEEQPTLDMEALRQGLRTLEEMAGEILYQLEAAGGELPLAAVPGVSLAEALSQLVETTAEELALSSRIVFSGHGRPLADYLARLLYRIAQEALARVSTHEGVRRLRFNLDFRHGEVAMSINDDGVPRAAEQIFSNESSEATELPPFLTPSQAESEASRISDQTMRRLRVMLEGLGGSLTINSSIEQGVQLLAHIPLHHHEHTEQPASAVEQTPPLVDTSAKVTILIVDSQAVSRAGLRRLLESYPDLEVVGEASDGMQAISETAELLPQLVLIDAQLPEDQSLEALRQLRQLNAEIRVLLLVGQESEALLYESLRAGASGYVSKESAPDELARAVRAAARGEMLVQPQLAARLLTRFGGQERGTHAGNAQDSLTAREQEVLQLLARGLRNKEIAARLFVSERTVNFHLANIYAKLHVSGRTEALSKALEQGLLKV